MLNLQNYLYIERKQYILGCLSNPNDVATCLRTYWGWNEIPLNIKLDDGTDAKANVDTLSIYLPLGANDQASFEAVCNIPSPVGIQLDCSTNLGDQLDNYMKQGDLVPGR